MMLMFISCLCALLGLAFALRLKSPWAAMAAVGYTAVSWAFLGIIAWFQLQVQLFEEAWVNGVAHFFLISAIALVLVALGLLVTLIVRAMTTSEQSNPLTAPVLGYAVMLIVWYLLPDFWAASDMDWLQL